MMLTPALDPSLGNPTVPDENGQLVIAPPPEAGDSGILFHDGPLFMVIPPPSANNGSSVVQNNNGTGTAVIHQDAVDDSNPDSPQTPDDTPLAKDDPDDPCYILVKIHPGQVLDGMWINPSRVCFVYLTCHYTNPRLALVCKRVLLSLL